MNDGAEHHVAALLKALPDPESNQLEGVGFIGVLWSVRMLETIQASLMLQQSNLGHVSHPLNRLVLELASHIVWLSRAQDQDLALRAAEADRLRHEIIRWNDMEGVWDEVDEDLTNAIARSRDQLEALKKDQPPEFQEYLNQFTKFNQLVASLGDDAEFFYNAFRMISPETHATLEIANTEHKRTQTGIPPVSIETPPSTLLSLAAVALAELARVSSLGVDLASVVESAGTWSAANHNPSG